jgi:SAM-dependent methyltransferase
MATMYVDIVELRDFYASPLGKLVRRLTMPRLKALWPDAKGMSVLGLGYAGPYLGAYRDEAERTLAFMPARQGVTNWPGRGRSASVLVDEMELPLNDSSIDRILLVHCLEVTDDSRRLLDEAWRVLVPGGRLMAVVPNRRGLWARFDRTPFGTGRPYSRPQVARLLRSAGYKPRAWEEALWVPPFRNRFLMRSAAAFERAGRFLRAMPGLVIVDAEKEMRRPISANEKATEKLRILPLPDTAPVPSRREAAGEEPAG